LPTGPADISISDQTHKCQTKDQTDTLSSDQADVVIIRSVSRSAQVAINDDIISGDSKNDRERDDSKDGSKGDSKDDDKRNSNERYIDSVLGKFLSKRKVTPLQPLHTSPSSSKQYTTLVERKNSEATRSENENDDQDYTQADYAVDINDKVEVASSSKQASLQLDKPPPQSDYTVDIHDNTVVTSSLKRGSLIHSDNDDSDDSDEDQGYQRKLNEFYNSGMI